MKVGILYAIEDLKIQDVATPNSSEGQILIKVEAYNICGTDIRTYHYGHKHIHFPRIAGQAKFGLWNRLLGPLSDCFAYLWMKKKYINYTISKKG